MGLKFVNKKKYNLYKNSALEMQGVLIAIKMVLDSRRIEDDHLKLLYINNIVSLNRDLLEELEE